MNPLVQVKQFESLQCNLGALPREGPEAVYHRSAGGIPLWVPVPLLSSHCHRMVKIALSLIESKYGEVIELGFFLQMTALAFNI